MVGSSSFAEIACWRLVLAILGMVSGGWLVTHIVYISRSEFQNKQQFPQLVVQIVLHKYILLAVHITGSPSSDSLFLTVAALFFMSSL